MKKPKNIIKEAILKNLNIIKEAGEAFEVGTEGGVPFIQRTGPTLIIKMRFSTELLDCVVTTISAIAVGDDSKTPLTPPSMGAIRIRRDPRDIEVDVSDWFAMNFAEAIADFANVVQAYIKNAPDAHNAQPAYMGSDGATICKIVDSGDTGSEPLLNIAMVLDDGSRVNVLAPKQALEHFSPGKLVIKTNSRIEPYNTGKFLH